MLPLLPTAGKRDRGATANPLSGKFTRQEFLGAMGAGAACLAFLHLPGCKVDRQSDDSATASPEGVKTFRSRPELSPPAVEINERARGTAPGYIFVAAKKGAGQDGPMIVDDLGQLVWFSKDRYATDFKVQRYRREPVLSWWEGKIVAGHGVGEYVIFDSSYREIARMKAGDGQRGDLHEFSITPQDTALLTRYVRTQADLSPIGGPKDGMVWEGIAREVDIETGDVLFEWRSLDHVGVGESYRKPPQDPGTALDYFHINTIEIDFDGNWLISAKGTSAVEGIRRQSNALRQLEWRHRCRHLAGARRSRPQPTRTRRIRSQGWLRDRRYGEHRRTLRRRTGQERYRAGARLYRGGEAQMKSQ
jgi:hypothetical protein